MGERKLEGFEKVLGVRGEEGLGSKGTKTVHLEWPPSSFFFFIYQVEGEREGLRGYQEVRR